MSERLVSRNNLDLRFKSVIRRAGLEPWAKLFQVLRRNRETDWAQEYPQYAASVWMGHDMAVSEKHYLQIPDQLYEAASGSESGRTATKTATKKPRGKARRT